MNEKLDEKAGLYFSLDELGDFCSVSINIDIYSRTAVFKTAYWFTEQCYLYLSYGDSKSTICAEIRLKDKHSDSTAELENFCREFCNALIDQQVRQDVISETAHIRDKLLSKAFGEGKKHLDVDEILSNESYIAPANSSFKNDPLAIGKLTGEK